LPVHIDEITSDVVVAGADLPLSHAQVERLVSLVIKRLKEKDHAAKQAREATRINQQAAPPMQVGD
jgi:hypothetical protein